MKGEELLQKAQSGEAEAQEIWFNFGTHLGRLVTTIIYSVAPEIIIFGGSVSKGYNYFLPGIMEILDIIEIRSVVDTLKISPEENSDIAVLGAAALCHNKKF